MTSVGRNVPRTDGADKATGKALYVDDLVFDGMLYGATIRSTEPHAELLGVEWDPDFDWSDVVRVEAKDVPGLNAVHLMVDDQPVLVADRIRHADEPVALIACADRKRLREARKHVKLLTKPLKPIFDTEESVCTEAPIYGDDNVFKRIDMNKGDVDAGFAAADKIIEHTYHLGYQEQMYIEPQGVIALPDEDGVIIYGSLQCPYYVVNALAPMLDLAPDEVRVIQCVTGGGFGGKEDYPSMISGHAALLALKAKRPVKIIYERSEDISATTKRHPAKVRHRTGFTADGRLVAMDIDVLMDGGAYLTLSPVVLSRAAIHAAGSYRCDNIRIRARVVATHTPPNGAFRGFGAPQVCFAIERQIDRVGAAVGLSPLEIRRLNILKVGDTTATGQVLTISVGSVECLETAVARSGYEEKYAALQAAGPAPEDAEVVRGIGLSLTLHGAGFTGNGEVALAGKLDAELTESGGVRILSGSTDIGQGTRTIFPQIAADALGVDTSLIEVADADTLNVPDSGPTVASRTAMVVGKLCQDAAVKLRNRLGETVAFDNGQDSVRYEDGSYVWDGGSIPFQQAARAYFEQHGAMCVRAQFQDRDHLVWDNETYSGEAYPCYGWACDVTEVEIDTATYIPKIVSFTSAHDVGKALNPSIVTGQIEGGSLQGLGFASMEELRMENGRYVNHRMTDCIIPTALDAPEMDIAIVEVPYPNGPHGAKGVGEIPMDLPAPAVIAAIEQAMGVSIDGIPCSPETLCRLAKESA